MGQTSPVTERAAFIAAHPHLDLVEMPDAWGRPMFKHTHVEAMWAGWKARGHAQTGQQQTDGDFYLVPREIIDQFPEINVNNYDHDDACALNAWGCEVVTNANPAFGPSNTSTDRSSK